MAGGMKVVASASAGGRGGGKGIRFAHSYHWNGSPAPNSSIRTFFGVAKATACPEASAKVRTLAKVLDLRLGGRMRGTWARCVNREVTG